MVKKYNRLKTDEIIHDVTVNNTRLKLVQQVDAYNHDYTYILVMDKDVIVDFVNTKDKKWDYDSAEGFFFGYKHCLETFEIKFVDDEPES
jgi:hypothetical protein